MGAPTTPARLRRPHRASSDHPPVKLPPGRESTSASRPERRTTPSRHPPRPSPRIPPRSAAQGSSRTAGPAGSPSRPAAPRTPGPEPASRPPPPQPRRALHLRPDGARATPGATADASPRPPVLPPAFPARARGAPALPVGGTSPRPHSQRALLGAGESPPGGSLRLPPPRSALTHLLLAPVVGAAAAPGEAVGCDPRPPRPPFLDASREARKFPSCDGAAASPAGRTPPPSHPPFGAAPPPMAARSGLARWARRDPAPAAAASLATQAGQDPPPHEPALLGSCPKAGAGNPPSPWPCFGNLLKPFPPPHLLQWATPNLRQTLPWTASGEEIRLRGTEKGARWAIWPEDAPFACTPWLSRRAGRRAVADLDSRFLQLLFAEFPLSPRTPNLGAPLQASPDGLEGGGRGRPA